MSQNLNKVGLENADPRDRMYKTRVIYSCKPAKTSVEYPIFNMRNVSNPMFVHT